MRRNIVKNKTDGDLLFDAVLRNPEDDTVRLIYADWLDEQGQHPSARFIRKQIRNEEVAPPLVWIARYEEMLGAQPHHCRRTADRKGAYVDSDEKVRLIFTRGFVSRVWMPFRLLESHDWRIAKIIGGTCPVQWVNATDTFPFPNDDSETGLSVRVSGPAVRAWGWVETDSKTSLGRYWGQPFNSWVHPKLFRLLRNGRLVEKRGFLPTRQYRSSAEAIDELGKATARLCRIFAGYEKED
jgi:uncharacterized protein (TIGR02996 family)